MSQTKIAVIVGSLRKDSFNRKLATALAADKQYAKAIKLQKQAIAKAPNGAGLKLNLAKIYLQSGDKAQALSELEALLKPGNDFPQRGEASELLKTVSSS